GSSAMLALQAMLAAPAVKAAAAVAGAVLILGNVRKAGAGTTSPARQGVLHHLPGVPSPPGAAAAASPPAVQLVLDNAVAIKAVPINDFQPVGGVPQASSAGSRFDSPYTPEQVKKVFNLGSKVLYDNKTHWVLGRFSVR